MNLWNCIIKKLKIYTHSIKEEMDITGLGKKIVGLYEGSSISQKRELRNNFILVQKKC